MGILVKNVSMYFGIDNTKALDDVSFQITNGEFVSLTGRSGSGKSTLLYMISSLDKPTLGDIFIDDKNLSLLSSKEIHRLRNEHIGFVFQFHYLLPELTALENVLMPALKTGQFESKRQRAIELLEKFQLHSKINRLPRQLSGGEQQRVAIARSLIMNPRYLFADEPTGNLDSINGEIVMEIFKEFNAKNNMTIIMVTHEPAFAAYAQRQIHLSDGRIVKDEASAS